MSALSLSKDVIAMIERLKAWLKSLFDVAPKKKVVTSYPLKSHKQYQDEVGLSSLITDEIRGLGKSILEEASIQAEDYSVGTKFTLKLEDTVLDSATSYALSVVLSDDDCELYGLQFLGLAPWSGEFTFKKITKQFSDRYP